MFRDDGLDRENAPVKGTITKAEHDQLRASYFETKRRQSEDFDYQWARVAEVFGPK